METNETGSFDKTERPGLLSYRVICEIAKGGMADVHLGEIDFPDQPRQCVIKRIRPDMMGDYEVAAFLREGILGYDLSNDNRGLVRTLHYGIEPDGRPVIIMEFAGGPHLGHARFALRDRWTLIRRIARDLLVTLGKLHGQGVLHRDISAANILLDIRGRVLLCDLGMARPEVGKHTAKPRITIPYASPEYLMGRPATRAADVYSVGAVLYEILTGATPYGHHAIRALRDIEQGKPIAPLPDDTPTDLARLIPWMLQVRPSDRPSADAALTLLEKFGEKLADNDDLHDFVDTWLNSHGFKPPAPTDPDEPVRRFWNAVNRCSNASSDADSTDSSELLDSLDPDSFDPDAEREALEAALSHVMSMIAADDESNEWTDREPLLNALAAAREMLDSPETEIPQSAPPPDRAAATAKPADQAAYARFASTLQSPTSYLLPTPSSSSEAQPSDSPGQQSPTRSPLRWALVATAAAMLLLGYFARDLAPKADQAQPHRVVSPESVVTVPRTVIVPDNLPAPAQSEHVASEHPAQLRQRPLAPAPSQQKRTASVPSSRLTRLAERPTNSAQRRWHGGGTWADPNAGANLLIVDDSSRKVK